MSLHPNELKILEAIYSGLNIESDIAETVSLPVDAVEYYMQQLNQKVYINIFLGNQLQLTVQGKVAATNPKFLLPDSHQATNQTTINASNSNIGFIQSGSGSISDFSQNINQNIDEIDRLIAALRNSVQHFPSEQREEAEAELVDLEEDIKTPDKHDPKRFSRRLKSLVAAGTAAATIASGAATFSGDITKFTENILELTEKLGVPIEFVQPNNLP